MKTKIVCFDFGRLSDIDVGCRYVIMCKPHWWDKWRIRDWVNRDTPKFYMTWEEARKHL